jgi:UDP-galactopyranose mutase
LPIRLNYNDNYYFDKYQGIPIGGYTKMIENMIEGIDVITSENYFNRREYWNNKAKNLVFTGKIDEFYDYKYGTLGYRSLRFETERHAISDYQGVAQMNFTSESIPFTRIIEHKHFEFANQDYTYITKEYPDAWDFSKTPYYPINNDKNTEIYNKYKQLNTYKNVIFGGRLAEYKYYDMHQIIGSAINKSKDID